MNELKIEYLKTKDIIPYENNPRKNDAAVEYVANSIKEFGFKVPIIIDKDNIIVAGHTRVKAAEQLGIEEVPCIRAGDLTDEQIKAFRLADNKVTEASAWDYHKLDFELADISLDMTLFNFEEVPSIDLSEFNDMFVDAEGKEKEPKKVQCPHCGEWFEI